MRSYLFAPATNEALVPKALASSADVVVLDLEDGILPGQEAVAHEIIREHKREIAKRPTHVRVGMRGAGYSPEDALLAVEVGAVAIRIPKASDVDEVAGLLSTIDQETELEVHLTVESARGLRSLSKIAECSTRITRAVFGERDFMADIGIDETGELTDFARAELAITSRSIGLKRPIDGAHIGIRDHQGLRLSAEKAKSLGFWGKSALHPEQVAIINDVFTPREEHVTWATSVTQAFESAVAAGKGVALFDGQFIDAAVARRARELLEDAAD